MPTSGELFNKGFAVLHAWPDHEGEDTVLWQIRHLLFIDVAGMLSEPRKPLRAQSQILCQPDQQCEAFRVRSKGMVGNVAVVLVADAC